MTAPADTGEASARTGPITRARASLAALEVLDRLREERRTATADEREVLRQWAGWGPMADAFEPDRQAGWADIGERIEWLLPPEEQIEARKATPNAFYTPPEITDACWELLRGLGFDGGRILEPGCGAGVFMGHTPAEVAGAVSWLGIERDPSTAAIAQAIYPDAEIINAKLEKSRLPTASVDAVLGNVPFANTVIFDPNAPEAVTKNLHNYCIWRSAQALRPGGVAVLITSRYTLDSADREAREALYATCDLLGAVRLPNVAWKAGGTEPVADILVLRRRRPGEEPGDDTWLDAEEVPELGAEVNRLFLSRPELVVGEHARDRAAQYGRVVRVDLPEGADWAAELRARVEPITQDALGRGLFWNVDAAPEPISAESTVLADAEGRKEGSFHLVDGKAHEVRDGLLRPVTKRQKVKGTEDQYEDVPLKGKELAEITALIGLRDTTVAVLDAEERAVTQEKATRDADDTIREQRRELARHEAALRTAMKAEPGADLQTLLFSAQHQTWEAAPNALDEARASAEAWQSADQQLSAAEHTRERAKGVLGEINTELGGLRGELNSRYDRYVSTYGFLNRCTIVEGKPDEETGQVTIQRRRPRMGGFRTDPDYFSVLALEDWDDDSRSATKAAIFSRRVNRAPHRQERAENVGEAIALCLDERGALHLPTIARLLDIDVAAVPEAMGDLAYVDPATGAWCTAEEYLSGNVRTKLDQALAAAETEPELWMRNVDALREVQPAELGPGGIHAPLGAPWIPASDVNDFLVELLGTRRPTTVRREPLTSTWEVKIDNRDKTTPEATAEWGTERVHAAKLVELALNGQTPEVKDTIEDPPGVKKQVRNIEATTAAEEKQRQVMARFTEWIWEEPERADRLAERYNRLFNSTVLRRYDGAHLTFPGLAEGFEPYPHQRDMVYQAISTQTALCGHAVGGGKTTIMFMTAMKLRQLGLVHKPMIVVPKHLLEQTAREGKQRFPGANILVADENDMSDARSRKLFAARCATGDWDAVIVTHPAFTRIPMHERNEADYLSDLAAKYRASLAAVVVGEDAEDDEFSKPGRRTKQVEKLIDSLEARVEYLLEHSHDDGIRFEHLGVDHLLVDEFHYFKNLMVPCHTEGFSLSSSKRATDMDMKLTWLRSRYDRVGTFYTGTAVSNSLLELYIVMHYLMPERLEELGIDSPDAWAAWCVQFETNVEIGPDGVTPRLNRRPSTFKNVPELLQLFHERADIRTQEDLGLKVPEVEHENVVSTASPIQRAYIEGLARRAENLKNVRPEKGGDNMLKVCTDGRKVAVDPELVGLSDPYPGKIDDVVANASRIFHETADLQFPTDDKHIADDETGVRGGFQIVFCDLGTPGKERGDQVYGKIRDGLVAQGVPRQRIRFIHDAGTDAQKAALFADCRSGKVAVLIGSTDKLGVGTNIQSRAVALNHLDAPWRPADVEQREGRVRRPGNRMLALQQERARRLAAGEEIPASWPENVRIFRYVTEGSFDGYMWQTLERKARFIAQVLSGKLAAGQREIDDIGEVTLSFAEVKALATGNPLLMDLATVKADVARLSSLAASHTRTQKRLRNNIARDQREIRDNTTLTKALEGISRTAEQAVADARAAQARGGPGSVEGQYPDSNEDREVVTPWRTADGTTLAEDKDVDTALAALAQHAMTTKRHSGTWLTWRGLRIGFELKDHGWRRQVLSAVINTGTSPHRGEHRIEVNVQWLAKGQHYRFRTAVVGAVQSAATQAAELREIREQLTQRIESSRAQAGKPFPQASELNTARARLEEINTELRQATAPPRQETATPAEGAEAADGPDAEIHTEHVADNAADADAVDGVDPEMSAMVLHDAQAMAGMLGDDVQVMVNARHVPHGNDEPDGSGHYRDAEQAEAELSDLTARVIGLAGDHPGHERAVTGLIRAKRLHGFARTADEHRDRSAVVPIPGLGTSTTVSGSEVAAAFGGLAEAAVRGERSGHLVWRGLRVEIGPQDDQLLAALSVDGDPEYPHPAAVEDVPLEKTWAEPDQHWQILRALDQFIDSAADRSRAARRGVARVLDDSDAAAKPPATPTPDQGVETRAAVQTAENTQSAPATPGSQTGAPSASGPAPGQPRAGQDLVDLLGLNPPQAQWLHRQCIALAQQVEVRDAQRTGPEAMPRFFQAALDRGLAQPLHAERSAGGEQPDPAGLEIAHRYANDRAFAGQVSEVALDRVRTLVNRDLVAEIPELVDNLFADLALPHTAQDTDWIRHWILDAAADTRMLETARANTEDTFAGVLNEHLLDSIADAAEGDSPPPDTVLDHLLSTAVGQRWRDLARCVIYDIAHERGVHAPPDPDTPAPSIPASEQPQAPTPKVEQPDEHHDVAAEPVPADTPAPVSSSISPSAGAEGDHTQEQERTNSARAAAAQPEPTPAAGSDPSERADTPATREVAGPSADDEPGRQIPASGGTSLAPELLTLLAGHGWVSGGFIWKHGRIPAQGALPAPEPHAYSSEWRREQQELRIEWTSAGVVTKLRLDGREVPLTFPALRAAITSRDPVGAPDPVPEAGRVPAAPAPTAADEPPAPARDVGQSAEENDQAAYPVAADTSTDAPEATATAAPSAGTEDTRQAARTLTFHYSFDRGVMLLGTDRGDGIGDLLRPDRAGWKWRRVDTPTGESGAWLLPKTRRVQRDPNAMRKFYGRLLDRITGAGNLLTRAGFVVQLDLHDLPEATARSLHAWESRTQVAAAQPQGEANRDTGPEGSGETRSARADAAGAGEPTGAADETGPDVAGPDIPASGGTRLAPELLTMLNDHGWVDSGFIVEHGEYPAPMPHSYSADWRRGQQRLEITWSSTGEVSELRLNGRAVPLTFSALRDAVTSPHPAASTVDAATATGESSAPPEPVASDDLNRDLLALYEEMLGELTAAGYTHRRTDTVAEQGIDHANRTVTTDSLQPFAQEMTTLADLVDAVRTHRHQLAESTDRQFAAAMQAGLPAETAARATDLLTRAGELDALARRTAAASHSERPFVIPRERGVMGRVLNEGDLAPTLLGFARAAQRGVSPATVLSGLIPADYLTWRGAKVWFETGEAGVQIQLACADDGGFDTIAVPEQWLDQAEGGQLLVDAVTGAVDSSARRADEMRAELAVLLAGDDRADAAENAPQQAAATTAVELPTLRELRALAGVHDLRVRVVRVADAAFVTVHEPSVPTPPVLSWPVGSAQAFDGAGRPMPVESAAEHLATYRATVPAELFTAGPGLQDWARRLAQLTPHVLPGPEQRPAVRQHVDEAVALAAENPGEAENRLRRAENVAGPLELTPEREAQVVREIHDHAAGYAWAGDIGRYLTDPAHLDGSAREWEWINTYVAAHPEVAQGSPDHDGIRARNAAERGEQEQLGAALSREANRAYRAGEFERALDLLDQAELAHPGNLPRWTHARSVVAEAMTAPPVVQAEQGELLDSASLGRTGAVRPRRGGRPGAPSPALGASGLEVWQAFHRVAAEGAEPPATTIPGRRIDGEFTVSPGHRRLIVDAGWPPPGERTGPRGPLTQADVALALLRMASFAPGAFGQIVARASEPGEWGGPGFLQGHRATPRGDGEPDTGQTDRVIAWGTHVEVEVGHLRAGAVRWDELAAWLRPGLSEDHVDFFTQAVPVWRRFHQRHDGLVLSPQARAAGEELLQVLDTVVAEVLTNTLRVHLSRDGQEETTVASVVTQARERVAVLAEAVPAEATRDEAAEGDAPEQEPAAVEQEEQGLPTAVERPAEPTLITPEYQIELLARINAEAARWFEDQLDASPVAQRYLRDRIGTQADVDQVRHRAGAGGGLSIGFAPRGWTGLVEHLRSKGFRDQDLVDAGVASVVKGGPRQGQLRDRFYNRIMFGIRDGEGRMAGFIGRDLSGTADAKYMNSHASALFDKSSLLLGLYEQRDLADHAVPVFVEGPFDLAAIIATARPDRPLMPVAVCGTALTSGHLDAVDALVPVDRRRVIALDGDEAGRKKNLETAEEAVRRYENLDITTLPDGLDPADFAKTVGVEEQVAAYLGAPCSLPAMEVLVEARLQLWEEQLQWIEGRVGAARHVAALLATVEPHRIADLALRVAARLEIEPEYMAEYIAKARNERRDLPPAQPPTLSQPLASGDRDRRDERPDAHSTSPHGPDTDAEAAPTRPELDTASPAARDDERPAELDDQQESAEPQTAQPPDETAAASQPKPEATETAAQPEVAVAPEPDTPAPENRDPQTTGQPSTTAKPGPAAPVDSLPAQPGPWTRRIEIEVTGNTAVVAGTSGGDPKVLRQALKDNGFRWRPQEGQVWKFFRRHGGPSRDAAVQSIRDVLADLDGKEAAKASPAPSYPPTPQQQAIIDACLDGRDVAVRALAGTGKTSTMRMVAARMPDKEITYIAFNRAIADEAQAAFGRNVTADTLHAFARQALRSNPRYQDKLGKIAKNDGFPEEIAKVLGHGRDDLVSYGPRNTETIEVTSLVRMALGTVKRFRQSADTEIGFRHVGEGAADDTTGRSALVLDYARRIWADKTDPAGRLRFVHDDYRKIWALGDPTIPGDVIIFDEVQDVNELQARLVQAQSAQTIVVGDSYQSIYGFTGAKDFLRTWPAEVTLPLTQSWRFGPDVAEIGNQFLGLLRAGLTLEGNPALDTRIEPVPDPDAVLCRTNAAAVAAVIDALDDGKRVALVGGGSEIKNIAEAAQELMRGRPTKHPDLSIFRTWDDVRDYVNQHEEAQSLKTLVRLIDKHRPDGLIAMADDLVDEDETAPDLKADLIVSTAHKAKGREWNNVRIADDFPRPTEDPDSGEEILPDPEALRLAYVTVTRARRRLDLGSLDWILIRGQHGSDEPAATTANQRTEAVAHAEPASQRQDTPAPETTHPSEPAPATSQPPPAQGAPPYDAERSIDAEANTHGETEVNDAVAAVAGVDRNTLAPAGEEILSPDTRAEHTDASSLIPEGTPQPGGRIDRNRPAQDAVAELDRVREAVRSLPDGSVSEADLARVGVTLDQFYRLMDDETYAADVAHHEAEWRADHDYVIARATQLDVGQARSIVQAAEETVQHLAACTLDVGQCETCSAQEHDTGWWKLEVAAARERLRAERDAGEPRPAETDAVVDRIDERLIAATHESMLTPPEADSEPAPTVLPQGPLDTAVSPPGQVTQAASTEQHVGPFPIEFHAGDLDSRDTLLRRVRERMESLPREIDGEPTGPIHLALAAAGSALTTVDAFSARATALRIAGKDQSPLLTARRISQFAGLLDAAVPNLAAQRTTLGFYQEDRSLSGHLSAISAEIERIAVDPVALARARAAALFDSFTVQAVRSVHRAVTMGDTVAVNEFFGATSRRGRLIEPSALQVLRDAFVAEVTKTRFEPGQRGQAEVELEHGLDTGIALQALAAEARNRARLGDGTGRVLRAAGIASIADNLDAVAASMATTGNFVLPQETVLQPGPDDVGAEPASDRPSGLVPYDVAFMLRHMAGSQFARLVRAIDGGGMAFEVDGGHGGLQRGDDEPDPGAPVRVRYNTKAVVIEVGAAEQPREGRITWKRLQDWIAAGITPSTRRVLLDADDAHRAFVAAEPGFLTIGERDLAQAARQELDGYRSEAITTIVDAALAEHEKTGGRPRRRRATQDTGALIAVDELADLSDEQRRVLDRITALTTVLPADTEAYKPLSQIEVGDVVEHPGYMFGPYRIAAQPVVHEDHVELTGDLLDYRASDNPTMWPVSTTQETDPHLRTVPRPRSLAPLMGAEDETVGASPAAATDATEPEHIPVPEDLDLSQFGWERVQLSYNEYGPVESWTRDGAQLTLNWESTDTDLRLATPILLNGHEHPISSIEEFQVVAVEAGQHGFASPNGDRWAVFATPTAAYAHDVVADGELRRLVTLDTRHGWVFTDSGQAVERATPPAGPRSRRSAAPPETEQFTLWDVLAESQPDPTEDRLEVEPAATTPPADPSPDSAPAEEAEEHTAENETAPARTPRLEPEPTADQPVDVVPMSPQADDPHTNTEHDPTAPDPAPDQSDEDDRYNPADYDLAVVPGADSALDPARWGWSRVDHSQIEGGVIEEWRRGDWGAAIPWTLDDQLATPLYLQTTRLMFDEDTQPILDVTPWEEMEMTISTAAEFREVMAEAGQHGWVESAREPGLWHLTATPTAALAAAGARAAAERREVFVHADDGRWRFVDTGLEVPLAPRTPTVRVSDRTAVERFVLGRHRRDPEARSLVGVALSGRARRGVAPDEALRRLADLDEEVYRRAAVAALGGRANRRGPFDVPRAQEHLQRLVDGDPTLLIPATDRRPATDTQEPARLDLDVGDGETPPAPADDNAATTGPVPVHYDSTEPGEQEAETEPRSEIAPTENGAQQDQTVAAEPAGSTPQPVRSRPSPGPAPRLAIESVRFVPVGSGDDLPIAGQIAAMAMPTPVRLDEPARLAFVHAQRAVREPAVTPAQRATIVVNLGESRPGEAAAVAVQLDMLAALMEASGQDPRIDGTVHSLPDHLRATGAEIRRITSTEPGPAAPQEAPTATTTPETPAASEQPPSDPAPLIEGPRPDPTMTWAELEGLATTLGFTVVKTRSATQTSTNHDLSTITVPWDTDSARATDLLFDELARLTARATAELTPPPDHPHESHPDLDTPPEPDPDSGPQPGPDEHADRVQRGDVEPDLASSPQVAPARPLPASGSGGTGHGGEDADLAGDVADVDDDPLADTSPDDSWGSPGQRRLDDLADLWAADAEQESAFDPAPADSDRTADDASRDDATSEDSSEAASESTVVSTEAMRPGDAAAGTGEPREAPAATYSINPVAQQWSALVAQAAELDFAVQTRYAGGSAIDWETRTIHIAFDQAPHTRMVDLAMKLVEVAIQRTPVETVPADTLARQQPEHTQPVTPAPVAAGDEADWTPTTDTPIHERLMWELGMEDTAEPVDATPSAATETREDLDTPLFAAVRRELGLTGAIEPGDDLESGRDDREAWHERTETFAHTVAHTVAHTPAGRDRAGLPGARPLTTGNGAARAPNDPVAASRSRYNR